MNKDKKKEEEDVIASDSLNDCFRKKIGFKISFFQEIERRGGGI